VVQPTRIGGPDDPRVAPYRNVSDAELLRAHGLFVAEGRFVVERLIEGGRFRVRSLLLNDAAWRALEPICARLGSDAEVYLGSPRDFEDLTGYHVHRGCLALAERRQPVSIDTMLSAARTIIVLEHVANADNVGGVFRNAAAFGAEAVLLSPTTCDPLYRKAIRTSMAATLQVPFATLDDGSGAWPAALARLRRHGFSLVAMTPQEPAQDLEEFARQAAPARLAILLGAEGAGVSRDAEAAADFRVRIPILPHVDSLNLAVASGIVLHRLLAGRPPGGGRYIGPAG
jgi:tRNA G18 (ribose-2'-O)-methylase SpoU